MYVDDIWIQLTIVYASLQERTARCWATHTLDLNIGFRCAVDDALLSNDGKKNITERDKEK